MKEKLSIIISQIFTACVFLFIALGVLLVAAQLVGILLRNGTFCVAVNDLFKLWMIRVAATAGILGFIKGYLKPGKK